MDLTNSVGNLHLKLLNATLLLERKRRLYDDGTIGMSQIEEVAVLLHALNCH